MSSGGSGARKRSDERGRSPARTADRRLRLKSRGEKDEVWLREIRQGRETARALFSSTSSTAVHADEQHPEYKNKNMLRASAKKGPLVVRASLELKSCLTRMFLPEGYHFFVFFEEERHDRAQHMRCTHAYITLCVCVCV